MAQIAPLLSILVPIYNVERYLAQCLTSITSQTLKDIEIICINDGSTDSSLSIIKDFMKRDPRIILINKKNTGYGDSMNQGLKKAKGKYVGIVEPDDFCALEMFQTLLDYAQKYHADVVRCGHYRFRTSKSKNTTPTQPTNTNQDTQKHILAVPDQANTLILAQHKHFVKTNLAETPELLRLPPAIWSAIYRRDFLIKNDIEFLPTPGASYQDLSFSFKVWVSAQVAVVISNPLYYYRIDNTNSSVKDPKKARAVIDEYTEIETFLTERGLFPKLGPLMVAAKFRNYHWNFQRLPAKIAKSFYREWRAELIDAREEGLLQKDAFRPRDWLACQQILHFPHLAYRLLRLRASLHRAH